jgi:hypothetical protein
MRQHNRPFAGIDPAPERFLRMWERRSFHRCEPGCMD